MTTAFLLAVDLLSVAIWGRNIGMAEDWTMVPAMTGHEPDLLGWLWSQNNEHRLPAQRLIYLGLLRATGDFRSGMILSQLLLALLVAALAGAAAAARGGRSRWFDLLIPLALLHLGHWENLVWGWQLQFVWSVVLTGLVLAIVAARPGPVTPRAGRAAAALILLLPVSGANGIVVTAAMAPWLAAQGAARMGAGADEASRRLGIGLIGAATLSCAVIGVYFIGYLRPAWSPPPPTPEQFARAAVMYFAYALGPAARGMPLPAAAAVALIIGCGGLLAVRATLFGGRDERLRAGGLALFIAAGVGVGLAIAWGRGALPNRLPDRYALFSALPLLAAAFAWEIYAPRRLGRRIVATVAVLFVLVLPLNVRTGFEWRDWYVAGMRRVEADLAKGMPIPELAHRHRAFLMHWSEDRLRDGMRMLRDAGVGPFANASAEVRLRP